MVERTEFQRQVEREALIAKVRRIHRRRALSRPVLRWWVQARVRG